MQPESQWTQPHEWRGDLPDAPGDGGAYGTVFATPSVSLWPDDDTRVWPEKRLALVPQQPADWRGLRLTRLALASFCLAAIAASLAIIFISARVVWAVWPK